MKKLFFKNSLTLSLSLLISLFVFSNSLVAQQTSPPDNQQETVLSVIKSNDSTSDFADILENSVYGPVLQKKGPYTVLAPSNDALAEVDAEVKENPKQLLQGHLFQGNVTADQVESQMDVTIEETDESAANGTVHFIDTVNQN